MVQKKAETATVQKKAETAMVQKKAAAATKGLALKPRILL